VFVIYIALVRSEHFAVFGHDMRDTSLQRFVMQSKNMKVLSRVISKFAESFRIAQQWHSSGGMRKMLNIMCAGAPYVAVDSHI